LLRILQSPQAAVPAERFAATQLAWPSRHLCAMLFLSKPVRPRAPLGRCFSMLSFATDLDKFLVAAGVLEQCPEGRFLSPNAFVPMSALFLCHSFTPSHISAGQKRSLIRFPGLRDSSFHRLPPSLSVDFVRSATVIVLRFFYDVVHFVVRTFRARAVPSFP